MLHLLGSACGKRTAQEMLQGVLLRGGGVTKFTPTPFHMMRGTDNADHLSRCEKSLYAARAASPTAV